MAGGTVTITGGNVIHTFNSSGYLTPIDLVGNSLRFRSSASAYLNRTPTVSGNRRTWTFSTWLKRGTLGTFAGVFGVGVTSNGGYASVFNCIRFTDANVLSAFEYDINTATIFYRLDTTQVFRDPAAWYHIVFAFDSTQATSSDRWKLYVNGIQVTAFSSTTYPSQNYDTLINTAAKQNDLGLVTNVYLDGYMTEVQLIDGQALTPNSFGTFNQYGVWQPITYGGSYGTNGFYLPFIQPSTSTYAATFDGSTQYLANTSSVTNQFTPTSGFTLEMWIKPTNTTTCNAFNVSGGTNSWVTTSGLMFNVLINYLGTMQWQWNVAASTATISGTTPTVNAWTHIAVGYNGTTTRLWINGVSAGTDGTAYTIPSTINRFNIASAPDATSKFTGQISNLRFVKGTDVYGVGNATITVPTSPLTAITNTQLLTLQSATVIDNSTNAFSITNTGSVVTSVPSYNVFANPVTLCYDQSPQGNNWTPNNISTTAGSTYDSMTDVPTLTSTTAANYAVWNPLLLFPNTTYQATMTNGNLLMTRAGGGQGGAATTMAATTGKFYAEMPVTAVGGSVTKLGVMATNDPSSISAGSEYALGDTSASVAYRSNGARLTGGTTTNSWGATYTTGDVIGVAFDADTGKVWFSKNGTFQASGDPAAGTNQAATLPTGVPFYFSAGGESGISIALNCGQQLFAYTAPSGFLPLNTFNL
jgi:hypothetical protein